jgi:hypothetical protein
MKLNFICIMELLSAIFIEYNGVRIEYIHFNGYIEYIR